MSRRIIRKQLYLFRIVNGDQMQQIEKRKSEIALLLDYHENFCGKAVSEDCDGRELICHEKFFILRNQMSSLSTIF